MNFWWLLMNFWWLLIYHMVSLDLLVVALDLLICFFSAVSAILDFYVVALDLPGSVDQEPPHGVVGECVWDVVVLDLPGLLKKRVLSTFR